MPGRFLTHCLLAALLLVATGQAVAADVGGWFADRGKPEEPESCLQTAARAERESSAQLFYLAALCSLQAEPADTVAARLWIHKSAQMNYAPAHRMLRALQAAEQGTHAAARHCHSLGDDRQLCHGGL
jgi:hypothetical protein